MAERPVTDEERQLGDAAGNVRVNLDKTGEGVGYRTTTPGAVVAEAVPAGQPVLERTTAWRPEGATGVLQTAHDRIRWGPIIAGLATTITTLVVLTLLGLAFGLSVYNSGSDVGTGAKIWSAVSAVLAFLAGGYVAGETAAINSDGNALLNGFLVGASALVLILWLAIAGIGNLMGAIGGNLGDIARLGVSHLSQAQLSSLGQQAQQNAAANAGNVYHVA
ncbi:MAG TPA: hypothetical protein VFD32_17885, partial [Dehalococcoidia bacterium]|nr:hypothetical protein [Dehalococcoidia bacterium]